MTIQPNQAPLTQVHPLFLPKGSVRALASLMIVGTAWTLILLGESERLIQEMEFINVVILVVSFYFGVRRTAVGMTGGQPVTQADPLYLPRKAIRTIMLLGFLVVVIYMGTEEGWEEVPAFLFTAFLIIIGYFVGIAVNEIIERIPHDETGEKSMNLLIRHLKALTLLGFTIFICGIYMWGVLDHQDIPDYFGNALAVAISLYYGARG
ncbi:MAG: hypothetical protein ACXACI_05930 [Candidatus Hodarchaeales archaeon]|jgi:hypothetical protein